MQILIFSMKKTDLFLQVLNLYSPLLQFFVENLSEEFFLLEAVLDRRALLALSLAPF